MSFSPHAVNEDLLRPAEPNGIRVYFNIRRVLLMQIMTELRLWYSYRAAQDAEAKRIADRAAMLAARRVSNQAALRPEPAAGSAGATALRIRLPDGSTHMRKFASAASLQVATLFPNIYPCMPGSFLHQGQDSRAVAHGLLGRNFLTALNSQAASGWI